MATLTIADLDNGQRDLQTVDAVANSPADTTTTRYGTSVFTLAGALRRLGYRAPVPYASGLEVDSALFTVSRDGVIYAPDPALVPFTTGAWSAAQWRPVQNTANTNQIYQFPTLGAAEAAAPTLPTGSAVVVDGVSQGHVTGGTYVVDGGVPAIVFQDYAAMTAYTGGASLFQIKKLGIAGLFAVIDGDTTSAADGGTRFVLPDGRRVGRLIEADILPSWWGMLPTRLGGGDISPNIDAALAVMRETGKRLVFDEGWYMHSLPIVLRSMDWVEGAGYLKTRFQKLGKTPASGLALRKAPGILGDTLGVVDDYNVDACFILYPEADSTYVYGVRLSGFYAESNQSNRSQYGLYAPRMCYNHFQDFSFSSQTAIYTRDCWQTQWDRVMADRCTYGWRFDGGQVSPGVYSGGTSNTFNSCFAHAFTDVGWWFKGLSYSVMNSPAADKGASNSTYPSTSYIFENSSVTINGGGSEAITGALFKIITNSKITTNNFFAGWFNEDAAKLAAISNIFSMIEVGDGSSLSFDNATLNINGVVGKVRPYIVYGERSVIDLRGTTILPMGGEIDSDKNQWGGGIVRSQQGFATVGYAAFDAPGGVLTVRRNSINVTVARVSVGEYRIVVRGGESIIGNISSSEARVEVGATATDSITYKFYNSSGALVDPRLVHWQGV